MLKHKILPMSLNHKHSKIIQVYYHTFILMFIMFNK